MFKFTFVVIVDVRLFKFFNCSVYFVVKLAIINSMWLKLFAMLDVCMEQCLFCYREHMFKRLLGGPF